MQKLAEIRANKLLKEPSDEQKILYEQQEIELESELKDLGVNTLTPSQAQAIYSNSEYGTISPSVSVPPSNSNVRWYEIRYSIYRDGNSYDLQDLYAQAVGYNTNLFNGRDGAVLYTNKQVVLQVFMHKKL